LLDFEIVSDDEEMDGVEVALHALGKGICPAHQTAHTGAQRAKPMFDVVGLAFLLAAQSVRALGKDFGRTSVLHLLAVEVGEAVGEG
jgi:hypothetical protein